MHYNALYLVDSRSLQTVHSQLGGVRNPVNQLLVLIGLLIKFESFKVR